jgi:hypothetical protein
MGFESPQYKRTERSLDPVFDIRVSRDDSPMTHKTVTLSYGGVTFEAKANMVNYNTLSEIKLDSAEHDIAPDEVARLKKSATNAFADYLEAEKLVDYQENFK